MVTDLDRQDTGVQQGRHDAATVPLAPPRRVTRRAFLRWLVAGGAGVLAAGSVPAASALYGHGYDGRVFRGVRVAGVALGGLTADGARARLDQQVAAYLAARLTARTPDGAHEWQITPADLGVRLDTAGAVGAALRLGRQGGWLDNLTARARLLLDGRTLALAATLDDARLAAALRDWAPAATRQPVNARFTWDSAGRPVVQPDQPGVGFDYNGSRAAFLDRAAVLSTAPVRLVDASVTAPITAQMLEAIKPQTAALVEQPVTLRLGDRNWTLGADVLRAAFGYRLDGGRLVVALDPAALQPFLRNLAAAVADPGGNAQLYLDQQAGRYAIRPERAGHVLDAAATVAALDTALTAGQHEAAVALDPTTPTIVAADLEPVRASAEQIANTPLVVTYGTYRHVFQRADLLPLLVFKEQPGQPQKVAIGVDPDGVHKLTEALAKDINQEPRDAKFKWVNGQVQDAQPSQDGHTVEPGPTDAALTAAILGATGAASPQVTVTPPAVASSAKAQMYFGDRLGYGKTDYSFSIPNRKWNVELACQRLNGTLVPPNATFSFNEAIGVQTIANGYKSGYGIAIVAAQGGGPGKVETVSSIGGGVCQVSTTLFQGIYHAGLPIEERNWHLYWIDHYGAPPMGLKGLDATVDSESKVDFKFQNNTGNWLLVEALTQDGFVNIAVYGKNPGWKIQIDQPVIKDVKPADPKPVYEKTHDLPPGQQIQIEAAAGGFTAINHIVVTGADGKVIRDKSFMSNYVPAQNVFQVGVPASEPTT
ncbi:MAG TPA: VanW family protein [Thermomicrobiales bacterium]|nr:VanW family protein [Thermomicrobiales bacterium]